MVPTDKVAGWMCGDELGAAWAAGCQERLPATPNTQQHPHTATPHFTTRHTKQRSHSLPHLRPPHPGAAL